MAGLFNRGLILLNAYRWWNPKTMYLFMCGAGVALAYTPRTPCRMPTCSSGALLDSPSPPSTCRTGLQCGALCGGPARRPGRRGRGGDGAGVPLVWRWDTDR